jgi:hypothetical protein
MEHQFGGVDIIRWQGRRNRRVKSGISIWAVVLVACALVGGSTLMAQVAGLLPWSGPLAAAPGVLVVIAISTQLVAVARAALAWLAG